MEPITWPYVEELPYVGLCALDALIEGKHVLELMPEAFSFTLRWAPEAATWRVALVEGMPMPEGYNGAGDLITRAAAEYTPSAKLTVDERPFPQILAGLLEERPDTVVMSTRDGWPRVLQAMTVTRNLTDSFIIIGEPAGTHVRMAEWFAGRYGYTVSRWGRIMMLTRTRPGQASP